MTETELRRILLIEIQRIVAEASQGVFARLGRPVAPEARPGFLTESDVEYFKANGFGDLNHPVIKKYLSASIARQGVLSYPLDGELTEEDITAIESLKLSPSQQKVLERVVAEACQKAFFHFLCMLDSVGDPEVVPVANWAGARFTYRRKEGPMLHDELGERYHEYKKLAR